MRAYRATPPSGTLETSNFLMLGMETRVPEHSTYYVPAPESSIHEYVDELITRMRTVHKVFHEQQ